jgi:hypothetical protein
VSILLQTGKDRQAMDTIVRFSELAQSLVRVVSSVLPADEAKRIGGVDVQEFYQELNGILSELLQAFESKDTVLIGDLMEYEVAPRLEKLHQVLEELV